jgi:hypothetical protein
MGGLKASYHYHRYLPFSSVTPIFTNFTSVTVASRLRLGKVPRQQSLHALLNGRFWRLLVSVKLYLPVLFSKLESTLHPPIARRIFIFSRSTVTQLLGAQDYLQPFERCHRNPKAYPRPTFPLNAAKNAAVHGPLSNLRL